MTENDLAGNMLIKVDFLSPDGKSPLSGNLVSDLLFAP